MTDVHNKNTRSFNMSRIKGLDTKPELLVRKCLHGKGLRYSLHNKSLPGKPDLCFKKYMKVLFINGCFWHGHNNCKYFKLPATRTEWWKNKIEATRERDKRKIEELDDLGWNSLIVWECDLKPQKREQTLNSIYLSVTKGEGL
jgi:DNA mismatch endonuclease, patch repair protein